MVGVVKDDREMGYGDRVAGLSRRLGAAGACALVLLLLGSSSASAATLTFSGDRATYTAAPGEVNQLFVGTATDDAGSPVIVFDDDRVNITVVGGGCERGTFDELYCDYVANTTVNLGDGNDIFRGCRSFCGGGFAANPFPTHDTVDGGAGNDELEGWLGDDDLRGGAGDDELENARFDISNLAKPFAGNDRIEGGPGRDSLSYAGRGETVWVTLDGAANDGAEAESDNVASDVEVVQGTHAHADQLVGDGGPNELDGINGDDEILGGGGNDILDGDLGSDYVEGGPGIDALRGGPGFDELEAQDGSADAVSCGSEFDVARVDAIDAVASDCENVQLPSSTATPSAPSGTSTPATTPGTTSGTSVALSAALVRGQRLLRALRRGLKVRVGCGRPCRVSAALLVNGRLLARVVTVARGAKTLTSAGTTTLALKFTRKAKRKLRGARSLQGTLRARATPLGGGPTTVKNRLIRLRR